MQKQELLNPERAEIVFVQDEKPGERFSAAAGQSPNQGLELAQVARLVQIALTLSSSIANLEAQVKKEKNNGRIDLSLSGQIKDIEQRQQRIKRIESISAETGGRK